MFKILFLGELVSIAIHIIISFSGDYDKLLNDYDGFMLFWIVLLCGWFMFPYFVYLAIRQLMLLSNKKYK